MFDIFVRWRIDDPWACSDVWCVMADDRDAAHVLVISTVLALSCCLDSFLVYYHTCPSWKRKKGRANTRMAPFSDLHTKRIKVSEDQQIVTASFDSLINNDCLVNSHASILSWCCFVEWWWHGPCRDLFAAIAAVKQERMMTWWHSIKRKLEPTITRVQK
jgi:hypothetical protein